MNSPQHTSLSKQLDQRLAAQNSNTYASYQGPQRQGHRISLPTENSSSRFNDLRATLNHKRTKNQYPCYIPQNTLDFSPPSSRTTITTSSFTQHRRPSSPSFHHNNNNHNQNRPQHRPSTRSHPVPITSTSTSTTTPEKRKREPTRSDDEDGTRDEIQCFDDEITPRSQPKHVPLRNSRTIKMGSPEKIVVTSEDETEEATLKVRLKTKQSDYKQFRSPEAKTSNPPNRNGLFENSNFSVVDTTSFTQEEKEEKMRNVHDRVGKRPSADTIFGNTARRHKYPDRRNSQINDTPSQTFGERPKTAHGRLINSAAEEECEFDTIRPAKTNAAGTKVIDRMQCKDGNRTRPPNKAPKKIHIEDLTDFAGIAKETGRKTDGFTNSQFGTLISMPTSDEISGLHTSAHLKGGRRMSEGRDCPTLEIKKIFYNKILNEADNTGKMELIFTPSAEFKIIQRNTDLVKMEWSQVQAYNWYDTTKVTSDLLIVISAASRDRPENDKGSKENSRKKDCYMIPTSTTEMKKFLKAVKNHYESSNCKFPFSVLTDDEVRELPNINQILDLKEITSRRSTLGRHALERDTQSSGSGMLTRSKRRSVAPQHNIDVALFSYPFGERGSVSITNSDLGRLNDQEFLNDNLIEWYLKFIQNEVQKKAPKLASSVHFFNSFFYKRLTENDQKGIAYGSVKKWTNKVDLFDKKYIFIPINENLHWYLALIYNPGYLLKPLDYDNSKEHSPEIIASENDGSNPGTPVSALIPPAPDTVNPSISDAQITLEIDGIDAAEETSWIVDAEVQSYAKDGADLAKDEEGFVEPAVVMGDGSVNDRIIVDLEVDKREDVAEVFDDETTRDSESAAASKGKSKGSKRRDLPSDKTRIIIFDSLNSVNKITVRRNLKEYLTAEALEKKNVDITDAVKDRLQMTSAKVPGQTNSCDCGVYLLHYVETFLSDPQTYLDKLVNREDDKKAWLYTTVKKRREKMRELADKLADEYEEWQTEKAKELSLQGT